MINILIVATGGTICSMTGDDGYNDVAGEHTLPLLIEMFKEKADDHPEISEINFEHIQPIDTLSENMTIAKWNLLIKAVAESMEKDYDGMIILHGTDSLHMTAPLMAKLLDGIGKPVVLVAANRVLSDPAGNGSANMLGAVRLIAHEKKVMEKGESVAGLIGSDVSVVYQNMDGVTWVHDAGELMECGCYTDDFFSDGMMDIEDILKSTLAKRSDREKKQPLINEFIKKNAKLTDGILYIKPYVGIDYSRYNISGLKAVLHDLYHAQTANSEGEGDTSLISLIKRCMEEGVDFYIFPCNEENYRYVSTKRLLDAGTRPLYGGTWNQAYVELLLDYSLS